MGIVIGQLGISAGTYDDIFLHETVNRTIYVTATGSDATGNGSSGSPYLTIGKALSTVNKIIDAGVTITVSIGVGTFSITDTDLTVISSISGLGELVLQGVLTLVDSGFTMGAADANDAFTHAVSGGNTASWTLHQWKYYFLKVSSSYYPITHNELTPNLSITGTGTGTEIYQAQTIINTPTITGRALFSTKCPVTLSRINLILNGTQQFIETVTALFTISECYISHASATSLYLRNNSQLSITNTSFQNIRLFIQCATLADLAKCYLYNNAANSLCDIQAMSGQQYRIYDDVFENPNTGSASTCLLVNNRFFTLTSASLYLKFVNSNICINFAGNTEIIKGGSFDKVILKSVNYVFRKNLSSLSDYQVITAAFLYSNFTGAPVIRWFYDSIYEFVNVATGRNIQITGLIYPEFDSNLKTTLLDAQTTNVVVGNKLQNRCIFINYLAQRGSDYEQGRLKIVHNGTNITLQQDTPLNPDLSTPITTAGITFAAAFSSNDIQLRCTLTNLTPSVNAILNYSVERVMITPLTI